MADTNPHLNVLVIARCRVALEKAKAELARLTAELHWLNQKNVCGHERRYFLPEPRIGETCTLCELKIAELERDQAREALRQNEEFLAEIRSHVEWMKQHGQLRVSQTRDSQELNAFNQGRTDAAESLLIFWDQIALKSQPICPSAPEGEKGARVTDEQIKYMVSRFLQWRLPENFNPDGGISFKKTFNENTSHPMKHEPVGTNLFDYTQTEAMIRYLIDGMPCAESKPGKEQPKKIATPS